MYSGYDFTKDLGTKVYIFPECFSHAVHLRLSSKKQVLSKKHSILHLISHAVQKAGFSTSTITRFSHLPGFPRAISLIKDDHSICPGVKVQLMDSFPDPWKKRLG
jgi:hypothetical protein